MRASRLISSSHEDLAGDLGDATELLRLRASPNLLMNGALRRWIPAKGSPTRSAGRRMVDSIEAHTAAAQVFTRRAEPSILTTVY